MRIGVISDTHGVVPAWQTAIGTLGSTALIIHAGDVLYHPPRLGVIEGYDIPGFVNLLNSSQTPIVIAKGNCDPEVYEELLEMPVQSPYAFVVHDGLRIVVQHGHTLSAEQMPRIADKYRAHIVITGHTHIPVVERIGTAIHLNPGSPSHPKFEVEGTITPTVGLISDEAVQVLNASTGETLISMSL